MADIKAALRKRSTRLKRLIQIYAEQEAKAKNDPLYKKFKKFRSLYFKYKLAILMKYGPKVRSKALQALHKSSK